MFFIFSLLVSQILVNALPLNYAPGMNTLAPRHFLVKRLDLVPFETAVKTATEAHAVTKASAKVTIKAAKLRTAKSLANYEKVREAGSLSHGDEKVLWEKHISIKNAGLDAQYKAETDLATSKFAIRKAHYNEDKAITSKLEADLAASEKKFRKANAHSLLDVNSQSSNELRAMQKANKETIEKSKAKDATTLSRLTDMENTLKERSTVRPLIWHPHEPLATSSTRFTPNTFVDAPHPDLVEATAVKTPITNSFDDAADVRSVDAVTPNKDISLTAKVIGGTAAVVAVVAIAESIK